MMEAARLANVIIGCISVVLILAVLPAAIAKLRFERRITRQAIDVAIGIVLAYLAIMLATYVVITIGELLNVL